MMSKLTIKCKDQAYLKNLNLKSPPLSLRQHAYQINLAVCTSRHVYQISFAVSISFDFIHNIQSHPPKGSALFE